VTLVWPAVSRVRDRTDALPDLRPPGRLDGPAGALGQTRLEETLSALSSLVSAGKVPGTTEASAATAPLVLDATCLSHFARADRLDVLRDLLVGRRYWTTETVLTELNQGIADYPLLGNVPGQEWLLVAGLDSVAEIRLYDTWLKRSLPAVGVPPLGERV
jgi:hypothetical protein